MMDFNSRFDLFSAARFNFEPVPSSRRAVRPSRHGSHDSNVTPTPEPVTVAVTVRPIRAEAIPSPAPRQA
jgi:hypothetical protein